MRTTGFIVNGVALLALAAAISHGCGGGRATAPSPTPAPAAAVAEGAHEENPAPAPADELPAQASAEAASEGNPEPAVGDQSLEGRCRVGEADACLEAGNLREDNDQEDALRFYQRACELGSVDGCGEAAELLEVEDLTAFYASYCAPHRAPICTEWAGLLLEERDEGDPEVLHAFRRACEFGDGDGCAELATFYEVDDPTPEQDALVLHYRRQACELEPSYCQHMGDEHLYAQRAAYDPTLALEYYRRACSDSRPLACYGLGRALIEGVLTPADPVEGARLLALACEQGNHQLACNLRRALAASPPAPAETHRACGSARRLTLGRLVEGRTGPIRGFASRCGFGAASPDQVYELRIERPSRVRFELLANFDGVLHVRRACDAAPEAELACNNDSLLDGGLNPFYSLLELDLQAGTYFVIVDGSGDEEGGTFHLVTEVVDPPR